MNEMNLTPIVPLARSLGRSRDEPRAVALRNLVSRRAARRCCEISQRRTRIRCTCCERPSRTCRAFCSPTPAGRLRSWQPSARTSCCPSLSVLRRRKRWVICAHFPSSVRPLGDEVAQHVERVFVAVGAHYEHGATNGRAAEAAAEGAEELAKLKKQLGVLPTDTPGLARLQSKIDTAIDNPDPPKHNEPSGSAPGV
jgi:hypothetical protein